MATSGDDKAGPDFDLVVIGCGVAGSAAAAAALEEAASLGRTLRVLVLERSTPEMRGGNSRWTAAYLRMTDIDTPAPGFVDDLVAHAGGQVDRAYAQRLADEAGPTLRWLGEKGVEFEELPTIFLTQARPRLLPVGGGRVVLDTLLHRPRRRARRSPTGARPGSCPWPMTGRSTVSGCGARTGTRHSDRSWPW